jgi:hypothetical protein
MAEGDFKLSGEQILEEEGMPKEKEKEEIFEDGFTQKEFDFS